MFHLKTSSLGSKFNRRLLLPNCDEAEAGEEHGLAASQSSNNNLNNFQLLQIPSTKSQVPHLTGSSNVDLLSPLPHVPVKKSTKQQGTLIPSWNVTEHTDTGTSQKRKKARVKRHL